MTHFDISSFNYLYVPASIDGRKDTEIQTLNKRISHLRLLSVAGDRRILLVMFYYSNRVESSLDTPKDSR